MKKTDITTTTKHQPAHTHNRSAAKDVLSKSDAPSRQPADTTSAAVGAPANAPAAGIDHRESDAVANPIPPSTDLTDPAQNIPPTPALVTDPDPEPAPHQPSGEDEIVRRHRLVDPQVLEAREDDPNKQG